MNIQATESASGAEELVESRAGVSQQTVQDNSICCRVQIQPESSELAMVTTPRVLLVDDNRNWSKATAEYLDEEGFHVSTAVDGLDAIHRLQTKEFEAVVLDINMPRMNGFEMMLEMKRLKIDLPVIMVTAKPEDFGAEAVLATGAKMYLPKPVEMETLVDAIDRFANRGEH